MPVDPTKIDATAAALAWVHPMLMSVALLLGAVTLRQGMALRRARRTLRPAPVGGRARHLVMSKLALLLALFAALLGVVSVWLWRGWQPLASFHGRLSCGVVLLACVVGWLGRRLERGDPVAPGIHGGLAVITALAAAVAAVTGLELLP